MDSELVKTSINQRFFCKNTELNFMGCLAKCLQIMCNKMHFLAYQWCLQLSPKAHWNLGTLKFHHEMHFCSRFIMLNCNWFFNKIASSYMLAKIVRLNTFPFCYFQNWPINYKFIISMFFVMAWFVILK